MDKAKLTWVNVDTDTLPADCKTLYEAMRESFKSTKAAKEAFEDAFRKLYVANVGAIPAGNKIVCTYLRGMAVALAPEKAKKAQGISLAPKAKPAKVA